MAAVIIHGKRIESLLTRSGYTVPCLVYAGLNALVFNRSLLYAGLNATISYSYCSACLLCGNGKEEVNTLDWRIESNRINRKRLVVVITVLY
jgi:hypothetical protein